MSTLRRHRSRHLLGLAAAVSTLVGLSIAAAPAAQAGGLCPDGNFCTFDDIHYAGSAAFLTRSSGNLGVFAVTPGSNDNFNDRTSSVINNSKYTFCLTDNTAGGGERLASFPPNTSIEVFNPYINDRASSAVIC